MVSGWELGNARVSLADQTLEILLIEDNSADARIFAELVKDSGDPIFITWVCSIADARAKAKESATDYSLIVTDLGLPDAQGMDTIRFVLELFPDRPVVVMTGLNDSSIGMEAVQRGCQDYVVKGFSDPILLVRMLRYATQRHAAERQIRESEERFRTLVQMSPDAIIIATLDRISFVNPAADALFGASDRDCLQDADPADVLCNAILNQDQTSVALMIKAAIYDDATMAAEEQTLLSLQGAVLDVEVSVAPITFDGARCAQIVIRDISVRRQRDREMMLAQAVFETTAEAMMITDADQRIISVNPAFCEVTGYSNDEIIGRKPSLLASGRHTEDFYRQMHTTLNRDGHWRGEIWNRRADGAIYVQRVTISAIHDSGGHITNYVGVFSDITEEKEASQRLAHSASHDALTGLPNRALLHDRLNQAITKAGRDETGLALLFIDLDGFKPINDTYGHLLGDLLLQHVGERLRASIRESDTVARLGGDEFVVVSLNISQPHAAAAISQKIIDTVSAPYTLEGHRVSVGCSIGFALFPGDGTDGKTLLAKADQAMYRAKNAGRGCYRSTLSPCA